MPSFTPVVRFHRRFSGGCDYISDEPLVFYQGSIDGTLFEMQFGIPKDSLHRIERARQMGFEVLECRRLAAPGFRQVEDVARHYSARVER